MSYGLGPYPDVRRTLHADVYTNPIVSVNQILAAVANGKGLEIFYFDVAQAFVRPSPDAEIYIKLPDGCGGMSGKISRVNKTPKGLNQSEPQWAGLLVVIAW